MKKMILACMAVAMLASCAKNDVVEPASQKAISFGKSYIGYNNESKAPYTNAALPTSFGVYALNSSGKEYFQLSELTKTGDKWGLSTQQYWPIDGSGLNIIGYAPYTAATTTFFISLPTASENKGITIDIKVPTTVDEQVDLLYSSKVDLYTNGSPIGLAFNHALSQIVFKANSNTTNMTITSIKVKAVVDAATMTIDATNKQDLIYWTDATTPSTADYTFFSGTKILGTDFEQVGDALILLPKQTNNALVVEIEALANSVTKTYTTNIDGTAWESGKKITYKVSINQNGLEFSTPSITDGQDWITGSETDTNPPVAK